MDTLQAFAKGAATRGQRVMVFDWDLAADRIREVRPTRASAGLAGDWENTGGEIWHGETPTPKEDTHTYLASTWATPELDMDGEVEGCWRYADESPGWDSGTYWPDTAVERLTRA